MLGCRKHAIRLLTDRARCVGAERFIFLSGLGLLLNGDLVVADQGNHTARLVRMEGKVSTRCRNGTAGYADGAGAAARFNMPMDVAVDGEGVIVVAEVTTTVCGRSWGSR